MDRCLSTGLKENIYNKHQRYYRILEIVAEIININFLQNGLLVCLHSFKELALKMYQTFTIILIFFCIKQF